ncbi:MAG: type III toxin-antitoxin system ToxN/AbiQ family toxin [Firmicutes bacterium]|nr:type III toxin-antitoxin system ToxN/AbiQ family toxin [Bacillota bacterium]
MRWKIIDENYLNYLRTNGDHRIPNSNYGRDHYKPFFGVLFTIEELSYVTQVSHAQPRHTKLKQQLDFHKLYDNNTKQLLAVVNLNYMFPIKTSLLIDLNYSDIDQHRTFQNDNEKKDYIALLQKELKIINKLNLDQSALKLYKIRSEYPNEPISKRCLDFKSLEALALSYSPPVNN